MRIAIIGTRGIPNNYGGFEQFAEYISLGLMEKGHEVTVYNPHFHPFIENNYRGVQIQRIYCPEGRLGSAAHFLYDFLSLRHAVRSGFDVIYAAGYGTLAPALWRYGRLSNLVVNMDGIEWRRSKWSGLTKQLMRSCERITVRKAARLVSDNEGIREYYLRDFGRDSTCIAYGADPVYNFDPTVPARFGLEANGYYLCIARMEPENNIETLIDGFNQAGDGRVFVVIGNHKSRYGQFLVKKYEGLPVSFLGSIYDKVVLDSLRHYARLYFHGHSVGGTNPSLLEAMAAGSKIAAHDNPFNRSVLNLNAFYFSNSLDVSALIRSQLDESQIDEYIKNNYVSISTRYSWDHIINLYDSFFKFTL